MRTTIVERTLTAAEESGHRRVTAGPSAFKLLCNLEAPFPEIRQGQTGVEKIAFLAVCNYITKRSDSHALTNTHALANQHACAN